MDKNDGAASLVRSDAWLDNLFSAADYIGIHKNASGRITLVVNDGQDKVDENGQHYCSVRTSCSIKGMSYRDKILTCCGRLFVPSNIILTNSEPNDGFDNDPK